MSGRDKIGGLIGRSNGDTITGCLWDVQTSTTFTSAGGTGKTTSEMQAESTFTNEGWDFVDLWKIEEIQTYPFLRKYFRF